MCLKCIQYQIRVEQTMSKLFEVKTSLKQGDAYSQICSIKKQ